MSNYFTCVTLASSCLKSGFLNDFEIFWVRRLLLLTIEGQGRNPCFEGLQRRSDFSTEIASLHFQTSQQKGKKIHASSRTFQSKIHPKGPELALEEN